MSPALKNAMRYLAPTAFVNISHLPLLPEKPCQSLVKIQGPSLNAEMFEMGIPESLILPCSYIINS